MVTFWHKFTFTLRIKVAPNLVWGGTFLRNKIHNLLWEVIGIALKMLEKFSDRPK